AFDHGWEYEAGRKKDPSQIGLYENFEILVLEVDHRPENAKSGRVDQNVHRAKHRRLLDQALDLVFLANISRTERGVRANRGRSFPQFRSAPRCENNPCAKPSQFDRDGTANAPPGAGDDGNLVFDRNHVVSISAL